jgi:diguanylate cyclase (GGDEF)-like protein
MNEKQLKTKERVVSLLSETDLQESSLLLDIEKLEKSPTSGSFHSELLKFFVHTTFAEDEAEIHWAKIFENYDYFLHELKHDIGLRVAIYDYFINLNKVISNPIMVEVHVFKETEKLAMVDSLTGLFNRRYFDVSLKKEINRALRYGKDMSILMIDLDNFKNINDSKGHLFGDKVLKKLATILTTVSREEDVLCRYGGEEFVIILPETNTSGALIFAERLRLEMSGKEFFRENNITFSGGISSYQQVSEDASKLLDCADKALYKAKLSGKNCSMVYTQA